SSRTPKSSRTSRSRRRPGRARSSPPRAPRRSCAAAPRGSTERRHKYRDLIKALVAVGVRAPPYVANFFSAEITEPRAPFGCYNARLLSRLPADGADRRALKPDGHPAARATLKGRQLSGWGKGDDA